VEGPLLSPTPRLKTGVARTPVLAFQRPRKERTTCSTYQNWYAPESHQPGPASRLSHKLKFDGAPKCSIFRQEATNLGLRLLHVHSSIFFFFCTCGQLCTYPHCSVTQRSPVTNFHPLSRVRKFSTERFWLACGRQRHDSGPSPSTCWLQIDFLSQIPRQSPPFSWLRRGELEYLTGYLFEIPLRQLKGLKLEPSKTVHNVCPLVCNCLVMTRQLWNSLINYTSSLVDFKTPEPCRSGV